MSALKNLPGIKRDEIAKLATCPICTKPILDGTSSTFYRVRVERAIVNQSAVLRHAGLSAMLGSEGLAAIMGTDEDLLKVFMGPKAALVHEMCAHQISSLLQFLPEEDDQKSRYEAAEG